MTDFPNYTWAQSAARPLPAPALGAVFLIATVYLLFIGMVAGAAVSVGGKTMLTIYEVRGTVNLPNGYGPLTLTRQYACRTPDFAASKLREELLTFGHWGSVRTYEEPRAIGRQREYSDLTDKELLAAANDLEEWRRTIGYANDAENMRHERLQCLLMVEFHSRGFIFPTIRVDLQPAGLKNLEQ